MELIHMPKLERDQIGVWNKPGWYLQKHDISPTKDVVMIQCQYGHSGRVPPEAVIGRDGVIDPAIQCHCLKFNGKLQLDDWPDTFYKLLGKEEIVKFYQLDK